MAMVNRFLKMEILIMDNIWWVNFLEKAVINGQMGHIMMVSFIMGAEMVMDFGDLLIYPLVIHIKVSM
jgi:hypothetical protein